MKRLVQKAKSKQRAVAAAVRSGEASADQPSHSAAPSGRSAEPAEQAVPGHVKRKLKKKAQFLDSALSDRVRSPWRRIRGGRP